MHNSVASFYTKDCLGSTREISDINGALLSQYDYLSFGQPYKIQGLQDGDFLFAGYYYDPTSEFYLTKYRAYSPALGRWISRDCGNSRTVRNLFVYCDNRPVSEIDPFGLDGVSTTTSLIPTTNPFSNSPGQVFAMGAALTALAKLIQDYSHEIEQVTEGEKCLILTVEI